MTADAEAPDGRALVAFLDLSALSDDENERHVREVCARARRRGWETASVCTYPEFVAVTRQALQGSPVRTASVAGDFPRGRASTARKVEEIRRVIAAGAEEVDAVLATAAVRRGDWTAVADEVAAFREACGRVPLKVILRSGVLPSLLAVARVSRLAMEAGADFIKTSTGKERVNATLPVGAAMCRAIREHAQRTGRKVGFKPAGGIRTAAQAREWTSLVRRELGPEWLTPALFRLGASVLLDDIEGRFP